jgi:hypothetical protein
VQATEKIGDGESLFVKEWKRSVYVQENKGSESHASPQMQKSTEVKEKKRELVWVEDALSEEEFVSG